MALPKPAHAQGDASDTDAKPAITDETVTVRVVPSTDSFWFWSDTTYRYSTVVFVTNPSAAEQTISLWLHASTGSNGGTQLGDAFDLSPGESRFVEGRIDDQDGSLRGGAYMELRAEDRTTLSTATADIEILPNPTHYWWAVGAAFLLALVVIVVIGARFGGTGPLAQGPDWKFNESWATNITVLGGGLTAILGATGFLKELAPNISDARIVTLNAAIVGVALTAPLLYLALAKPETIRDDEGQIVYKREGTRLGFLLAAFVTTAAILGQLAVGALITIELDVTQETKIFTWVILAAGIIAVALYVWRTSKELLDPPEPPPEPPGTTVEVTREMRAVSSIL